MIKRKTERQKQREVHVSMFVYVAFIMNKLFSSLHRSDNYTELFQVNNWWWLWIKCWIMNIFTIIQILKFLCIFAVVIIMFWLIHSPALFRCVIRKRKSLTHKRTDIKICSWFHTHWTYSDMYTSFIDFHSVYILIFCLLSDVIAWGDLLCGC